MLPILGYILFAAITWPLLMFIFNYATYHRYALWAVPLVVVYGAGTGAALVWLGLPSFLFWHVVVFGVGLVLVGMKQVKLRGLLRDAAQGDAETESFLNMSGNLTLAMYTLSAVVYMVSFFVTAVLVYNVTDPSPVPSPN